MDLLGCSGDAVLALCPASVYKRWSLEKSSVVCICFSDSSAFMSIATHWAKGNHQPLLGLMLSPGQGFGRYCAADIRSKSEAEGL